MPKRPLSEVDCGDSHCLQTKIHVGNREINQGIGAASNMKAVYQRTLSLLFEGSKGKINQNATVPTHSALPPVQQQPKYFQTILTSDGHIIPQTNGHQETSLLATSVTRQCMSCSSVAPLMLERCRFCEGTFCDNCYRPCYVCSGEYCNRCSIQIYSREECSMCLSCATERGPL